MPPVTEINKKNAILFNDSIFALLDFVDSVLPYINSNEYLRACDNLLIINRLKEHASIQLYADSMRTNIRNTNVFREQNRRTQLNVKPKSIIFNDAYKLNNGWKCCEKCNRIVRFVNSHQYTDVCFRTYDSKKISSSTRKYNTTDIMMLIHRLRAWYKKYKPHKL